MLLFLRQTKYNRKRIKAQAEPVAIGESTMSDLNAKTNTLPTFDEILLMPEPERRERGLVYTPAEILQQPATWIETFGIIERRQDELREFLDRSGLAPNVLLIGAGTSDYIGRTLVRLIKREWRCPVEVAASTDLMTEMDGHMSSFAGPERHLWISFSRSGDSFEGVRVLERAFERYPDVDHLIVTCSKNGKMAGEITRGRSNVFVLVLDDMVNDKGLAMTSSFTNMIVAGQCLAHIADLETVRPILNALANSAEAATGNISALAREIALMKHDRICFLGSGPLKGVAIESALKVLELTAGAYSVMSESFLGLRHGPLAWLNERTLVAGFLSNDGEKRSVELGLLAEVTGKNAAANVLAIAPQNGLVADEYADLILPLELPYWVTDDYRAPLDIMFAQFLGVYASILNGLKPDSPSSEGKINRVVSDIRFN